MKGCYVALSILLVGLSSSIGFAQSATITTYAGPLSPVNGAQATIQVFGKPSSVVADQAGGFYFASIDHHRVYGVAADGAVRVIAGNGAKGSDGDGGPATSARLDTPSSLVVDLAGNLFIADSAGRGVRKVTPDGVITTVAGTGTSSGAVGDGGPATSAQLDTPEALAIDSAGNLFIADRTRIRKVNTDGVITTIAGTYAVFGFRGDGGPATSALLRFPTGLAVDSAGNLLIADTESHRIRKVNQAGIITTIAGSGVDSFNGDGVLATSAQVSYPRGLAVDAADNLFIADSGNNRIRKINLSGVISTVAGGATAGFSGDGGSAGAAQLAGPGSVGIDASGNIFIADVFNERIRRVNTTGIISTVAGARTISGFSGDGSLATSAQFNNPSGLAIDVAGSLFIADTNNGRIRKVAPDGVISTVAGSATRGFGGDGGPATSARLLSPTTVAVDRAGNLFVTDGSRIRKITPGGVISTAVGVGTSGFSGDGGPATSAQLFQPRGIAVDTSGNLFIADSNRVRKVTPAGIISTVAGSGMSGSSGDGGPATAATFIAYDVAVDVAGNLFIADAVFNRIRKVTPGGVISTVAGAGSAGFSGDDGPATSAQLNVPRGVAVDGGGNLFITDSGNLRIRKITPDGIISTVAGTGLIGFGDDDVPPIFTHFGETSASLISGPYGVVSDGSVNLFIADTANQRVRKITLIQPPQSSLPFSFVDRGGMSRSSSGASTSTVMGYATIQPNTDSTTPSGVAIFGFRQNGILVTEAGVPVSPLLQSGRIYAEVNGPVNTGLAIANPNNQPATVSFFFTGPNGILGAGNTTIPANGQIAAFLNERPFNGGSSVSGSFTFNSSVPVSAVALGGLTNERGEFLITTLPVTDLSAPAATGTVVFPHFADGGGSSTQIVLVNPSDTPLTGTVQFLNQAGQAVRVGVNGQSNTSFGYSIPARASQKLQTTGGGTSILSGSVRVMPTPNTASPSGLAIFSFRNAGVTVAEAGVPVSPAGTAFRLYAEASGTFGAVGSIQTGIAVTNTTSNAATVTLELTRLDGSSTGSTGTLSIPANGQVATFLNQIAGFTSLQTPFQGVLRVSSVSPVSVVGLRARYNERGDFLMTTTPPVDEAAAAQTSPVFFPQIADGGGVTTQLILFSARPGQSPSGTMQLFSQSGAALGLSLR